MRFIFLLLSFSISFAQLSDPPIDNMTFLNSEALSNLQSNYLNQLPKSTPSINSPIEAADARLIKLDPSVDNFISAEKPPKLIWVWAEKHAEEVNLAADMESCNDGVNLRFKSMSINPVIEFLFNSNNKMINDSSSFSIDLPFSTEELSITAPYQNITISLSGEFNFLYDRTVLHYQYLPCSEGGAAEGCVATCELYSVESDVASFSRQFSSVLNYNVEGGNTLFFLTKPVLREQWYRNNKFNNIVFSNRVFYKAVASFNDENISNTSIYDFDIYNDSLGIFYIKTLNKNNTNSTNLLMSEEIDLFSPHTIQQQSYSFSYLYQVNTTYAGVGENNITLRMVDRFLNSFDSKNEINSRMLSLDGATGDGYSQSRPSLNPTNNALTNVIVGTGVLGIFLFLVLKKSLWP